MIYHILLVEDDPMVLMINQRYVEALDEFQVVATAQTLSEAQHILQTENIDLVLIDINLRNDSGIDLAKWIRTENIATELIIISADNHTNIVEMATAYGAMDYILKPFNADRLHQSLKQFKQKMALLSDHETMTQDDLDSLYGQGPLTHSMDQLPLEKGISRNTLNHLLAIIKSYPADFDTERIAQDAGLSHVTVRKYIQYLVDRNILGEETIYGSIGRPTTHYWLL